MYPVSNRMILDLNNIGGRIELTTIDTSYPRNPERI